MGYDLGTAMTTSYAVSGGASIGGGILGIVSAVMQHKQDKTNAKIQEENALAQQRIMKYNQRLSEREAQRIEDATTETVRRQHLQSKRLKAQQMALLGKSGAAMTSGSPLAILGQTAADEELKIQDTAYGGYAQAMQQREQGKMYGYQGDMYGYQAAVARKSAPSAASLALNIAGQTVNTVGKVAQLSGNYVAGMAQLQASSMAGKPLFG